MHLRIIWPMGIPTGSQMPLIFPCTAQTTTKWINGLNLISAWTSNYILYKVWDEVIYPFPNYSKLLIHSQTSTVQPLTFGKVWVISMLGLKLIHVDNKKGPLSLGLYKETMKRSRLFKSFDHCWCSCYKTCYSSITSMTFIRLTKYNQNECLSKRRR